MSFDTGRIEIDIKSYAAVEKRLIHSLAAVSDFQRFKGCKAV